MNYLEELKTYQPIDAFEVQDKKVMLELIRDYPDTILSRKNEIAHMTASSMIMNAQRDKVLLAHHNLYHSWGWTGGHADGEEDLLQVALKEAMEETGIHSVHPLCSDCWTIEILPVYPHYKRGKAVNSHLHLNFTYLLEADEKESLHYKADENSAVSWVVWSQLQQWVSEVQMLPVYEKILNKAQKYGYAVKNG